MRRQHEGRHTRRPEGPREETVKEQPDGQRIYARPGWISRETTDVMVPESQKEVMSWCISFLRLL